jgi:septal ring factor EnvC (AmiA/AmiB activator)
MTRSEYLSTLPPWRRLLATLNWRPVYDIEQQEAESERQLRESDRQLRESERRILASNRRLKKLENEIAQLQESNARIARFERELFSSSSQPPSTGDSSPT